MSRLMVWQVDTNGGENEVVVEEDLHRYGEQKICQSILIFQQVRLDFSEQGPVQ